VRNRWSGQVLPHAPGRRRVGERAGDPSYELRVAERLTLMPRGLVLTARLGGRAVCFGHAPPVRPCLA